MVDARQGEAEALRQHVAALADHLRAQRETHMSVADIATLTEVLIGSMKAFLNGVDTSVYAEFREMAEYLARAKAEIMALQPHELKQEKLPRAGRELSAIVSQTEEATHQIMQAAEELMNADCESLEDYRRLIDSKVTEIFEACSFQDITGQRIAKVIETLSFIDKRLSDLAAVTEDHVASASVTRGADTRLWDGEERRLMNGPSLDGDGVDQEQVDALLR